MTNLVSEPDYASIVEKLDGRLWELLGKIGDDFHTAQWYIDRWNLKPGDHGSIPYDNEGNVPPQSPQLTKGAS